MIANPFEKEEKKFIKTIRIENPKIFGEEVVCEELKVPKVSNDIMTSDINNGINPKPVY